MLKFLVLSLLALQSVTAFSRTDVILDELESIVERDLEAPANIQKLQDEVGSKKISKEKSLNEILQRIQTCRSRESLATHSEERANFKSLGISCRLSEKEILVTETLVEVTPDGDSKIVSYQELTFEEQNLPPSVLLNLLAKADIQKAELKNDISPGLRTMLSLAKVGAGVAIAFRTSKLLAPDRTDWQKHVIAGALISGVTVLGAEGLIRFIAKQRGIEMSETKITVLSSLAGLLMSVMVGTGKEVYDRVSGRGTPEFKDIMYTAGGGAMVSMTYIIPLDRLFRGSRRHTSPVPVH